MNVRSMKVRYMSGTVPPKGKRNVTKVKANLNLMKFCVVHIRNKAKG